MKTFLKNWGYFLITLVLVIIAIPDKTKAQNGPEISFQTFYDELSPYGEWINDPEYGYVWVPDAQADFQPYASQGHWVVTQYGNTWVSDYDWGWAPFHYGRWRHNKYYGWQWIPGQEWGPAWVSWRNGGGYYGWAPLGPRVSIDISFGRQYYVPNNYWVFLPQRYISDPYMGRYYVPRNRNVTIINQTTIIHNTYVNNSRTYITGPGRRDIERVTRNRVNVYNISNDSRPGRTSIQNGAVNVYRPAVRPTRTDEPSRTERPSRAVANNPANGNGERAVTDTRRVDDGTAPINNNGTTRPTRSAREITRPDNETDKSIRNNREFPVTKNDNLKESSAITERPARVTDRPERSRTQPAERQATSERPVEQPAQRPATRETRAAEPQRQAATQTQRAAPPAPQPRERASQPQERQTRPAQTSQSRPSRGERR
ncbi:MAG: DUF6600 domain-containing protein [Sphingobacteriaceae bacterium]